jgi:hypothetical protein
MAKIATTTTTTTTTTTSKMTTMATMAMLMIYVDASMQPSMQTSPLSAS